MKMILITYGEAIDEAVMGLLRSSVQAEYTKWTKVSGWGQHAEPHLMNHDWPKGNSVLMTCVEDEKAGKLLDGVRELKKTLKHEGIKAFSMPVDDMT